MEFNYGLLKERIRDEYKTCKKFATAMGITNARMSLMLNGKAHWSSENIYKAAKLLGLDGQIESFFFKPKLEKPRQ